MSDKYLINCQQGNDDLEKATVAMIVAGAASAMNSETAMFLTCEAVTMAKKGAADGMQAEGDPAMRDLMEAYFENEGKLWVCPVCAAAHGITEDDLVEGAEIAGAARTIGFVSDGAKILM